MTPRISCRMHAVFKGRRIMYAPKTHVRTSGWAQTDGTDRYLRWSRREMLIYDWMVRKRVGMAKMSACHGVNHRCHCKKELSRVSIEKGHVGRVGLPGQLSDAEEADSREAVDRWLARELVRKGMGPEEREDDGEGTPQPPLLDLETMLRTL
jgi:hypothetical protein